jgi:hypothetical protein
MRTEEYGVMSLPKSDMTYIRSMNMSPVVDLGNECE